MEYVKLLVGYTKQNVGALKELGIIIESSSVGKKKELNKATFVTARCAASTFKRDVFATQHQ